MLKNIKIYLELISFFITIDDRHVKQNYGFFFFVFWNHVVCQQLKFKMIYASVKTKKNIFFQMLNI